MIFESGFKFTNLTCLAIALIGPPERVLQPLNAMDIFRFFYETIVM